MAAGCKKYLKHLLGSRSAEVARAELALAVLDRERPEQPNHRTIATPLGESAHRLAVGRAVDSLQRVQGGASTQAPLSSR